MQIPETHQAVMPYLILKDARRFIDFTAAVFNATVTACHTREGTDAEIMHAEVNINGSIVMFAEATEAWGSQPAGMFVYVDNADEAFAKAQAAGAEVIMGLTDQDYGRTCGVKDPAGNIWWVTSVH